MSKQHHPRPNEFAYLREQRNLALHGIQTTLTSLGVALKQGADPRLWARTHPWATAGTAFGLGMTAGYAVVPSRTRVEHGPAEVRQEGAPSQTVGTAASLDARPAGEAAGTNSPVRDKLATAAKSLVLGAAYGLGRVALNQVLNGFLTGMHPPDDQGPEDPAAHPAETFSWQPESPT